MPYKYPKSIGIDLELYSKLRQLMEANNISKFNELLEQMIDYIPDGEAEPKDLNTI